MSHDFIEAPVTFTKNRIAEGKAAPSLVSDILEKASDPKELEILKYSAVSMYGGGADTVREPFVNMLNTIDEILLW